MSTRTATATERKPAVDSLDGTDPALRGGQRAVGDGSRARVPAASLVADLAAERFRAYRAGDRDALDAMVHSLTPLLWHIVRAYGLDTASAEDVVQNTWLTLVRKADTVAEPQAVLRWLTVTARRDAWRAARAGGRVDLTDDTTTLDIREPAREPGGRGRPRRPTNAPCGSRSASSTSAASGCCGSSPSTTGPDYAALSQELGMPMGSIGPTRGRCLDKLRAELAASTSDWSPA